MEHRLDLRPSLISKVLVLDDGLPDMNSLRSLYTECGLIGIRPPRMDEDSITGLLKSNIDLGGIMLYEGLTGIRGKGLEVARLMHALRPELPLFLRRDHATGMAGLSDRDGAMFRCAYALSDLDVLRRSLDSSIFSRLYPMEMVRGIAEFTRIALESLFHQCSVEIETPYLVKDRIIYGQVFTMIAIENSWCRGYMMLQGTEEGALALIAPTNSTDVNLNFRDLNSVLGEATNLIWGSFKSRYGADSGPGTDAFQTQVPIIINHHRSYISFGSDDPQLCFRYTLLRKDQGDPVPVPIYQRFVFNLNWIPELFQEAPPIENLVSSGELEMF